MAKWPKVFYIDGITTVNTYRWPEVV